MTAKSSHFHTGPREEQDWRQFENRCLDLIKRSLPDSQFRLESSRQLKSSKKSMDIHCAERRPGGRGFVFECKHYTASKIQTRHVDQVLEYKRRCRATAAVLLISKTTEKAGNLPLSVLKYAEIKGVHVHVVEDQSCGLLHDWLARRMFDRNIRRVVR